MAEMMNAARLHAFGGPDVLRYEDVPRPEPKPDEILVRIHAAGVNPVDAMLRQGYMQAELGYALPLIPGCDFSGVVHLVGADVTRFQSGDAVYSYINLARNGAYAEFVAVPESELALKPTSLDFLQAAAVPVGALTAWQAIFDKGKLTAGQTLLVHGASGGVGMMAVQLAKAKGARVIGVASGKNEAFVRELGADDFIDYTTTRFEDAAQDVDVVLGTIAGDTMARSYDILKPGGILVSLVGPPPPGADEKGVRAVAMSVKATAAELEEITKLIEAGQVKPFIQTVLPLSQARQAQELVATGHTRGKIILQIA